MTRGGSGVVIIRYKSATCTDQSCATDYYHDGASCIACPTGSNRLPDTANQCLCPENYRRHTHASVRRVPSSTTRPGRHRPGWRRDDVLGRFIDFVFAVIVAIHD